MESFDLETYIMHHLGNSQQWHIPFLPTLHLPEPLSLHSVKMILCGFFLFILFGVLYNKKKEVPTGLTNCLECFVLFIRDQIAVAYLGEKDGRRMTPLLCTLFFFILGLNIMGLTPLFSTATANFNVTAGLASIVLGVMIFGAIYKNGLRGFLKALMPSGVPALMLVILMPIEFMGLFIKAFALTIRLFANMLAGHIVILSLLGLIVMMGLKAMPAIILALFIYVLEIFVAFLQAYIFTLLSAMFIAQVHAPDH